MAHLGHGTHSRPNSAHYRLNNQLFTLSVLGRAAWRGESAPRAYRRARKIVQTLSSAEQDLSSTREAVPLHDNGHLRTIAHKALIFDHTEQELRCSVPASGGSD